MFTFKEVKKDWSQEELLDQEGIFSLKDVAKKLGTKTVVIRRQIAKLERENKDAQPWEVMGVSNWAGGTYLVDMQRFKNWWKKVPKEKRYIKEQPEYQEFPKLDSIKKVFELTGVYLFEDVKSFLPIPEVSLKNSIRKSTNPESEIGVWCVGKVFYVRMETFRTYLDQTVPFFKDFLARN
ncbi:MAG: hypothetical protein H6510_16065 [Acidobacteria bacterium]|nr:hypothetical protein [Acidobacteriota bacterium]MCB9399329.1 hypothetical protein [Acidobacteriota bacterium]